MCNRLYPSSVAGQPPLPPEIPDENISSTGATLSWNRPEDPNGQITRYTVNIVLLSSTPSQERRKRQTGIVVECIMGGVENADRNVTVPGDMTSTNLEGLSKL